MRVVGVCVCARVCACMNVQGPPVRITVRKRADYSAAPSVRTEAPSPTSFQKKSNSGVHSFYRHAGKEEPTSPHPPRSFT